MGARKGVNEKKQKGMDLKAANKAAKDAVKAAAQERKEGKPCIHVFVMILSTLYEVLKFDFKLKNGRKGQTIVELIELLLLVSCKSVRFDFSTSNISL